MNWIVENWTLVVTVIAAIVVAIFYVKKFLNKPTDEQIKALKEWMLWITLEAERQLGSGTGKAKLRFCFNEFIKTFPWIAKVMTFDEFSCMIDSVLVDMRKLLETNEAIKEYVNG